jgi:hypothetical protein
VMRTTAGRVLEEVIGDIYLQVCVSWVSNQGE